MYHGCCFFNKDNFPGVASVHQHYLVMATLNLGVRVLLAKKSN
jgi:hypothetical protein